MQIFRLAIPICFYQPGDSDLFIFDCFRIYQSVKHIDLAFLI